MNFLILENQIQDLISPNCGQFQLYSYKNLFDPDEKSKILSHGTLSNSTLETIINEIFSTDLDKNEHIVKNCEQEYELFSYLFLGNKKLKMSNRFIPSNGVGELYLDMSDMHWYLYESSCYNIDKEIPFMKLLLLLDMASLQMRYYLHLNGIDFFYLRQYLTSDILLQHYRRVLLKLKV